MDAISKRFECNGEGSRASESPHPPMDVWRSGSVLPRHGSGQEFESLHIYNVMPRKGRYSRHRSPKVPFVKWERVNEISAKGTMDRAQVRN